MRIRGLDWKNMSNKEKNRLLAQKVPSGGSKFRSPNYASDIEAAWKLVREALKNGYKFHIAEMGDGLYQAIFVWRGWRYIGVGSTEAEAICVAFLRASGETVEGNIRSA